MARRNKHDAQVDPFNAGEPVLPWDAPHAFFTDEDQEGEDCSLGEGSYNGPNKAPDNYEAPEQSGASAGKRPASQRSSTNKPRFGRPSKTARRDRPKRTKTPLAIFKTIFIFAVVVNLIPLVFGIVTESGLPDAIGNAMSGLFGYVHETEFDVSFGGDSPAFEEDEEAAEAAKRDCVDLMSARLDAIAENGAPERERVASFLNSLFENNLGYTADELGIDSEAFASWLVSGFRYEIDSCFVYENGEASLYFDTWCPSAYAIADAASGKIYEYLNEAGALNGDVTPLTDEQKDRARSLFAEAIDGASGASGRFCLVSLSRKGDAWTYSEAELNEQVDMALDIW